jgi:hypothetical protein
MGLIATSRGGSLTRGRPRLNRSGCIAKASFRAS